jgi:hypothetical protein
MMMMMMNITEYTSYIKGRETTARFGRNPED